MENTLLRPVQKVTWWEVEKLVNEIAEKIYKVSDPTSHCIGVIGIARGGLIPAVMLAHKLGVETVMTVDEAHSMFNQPEFDKGVEDEDLYYLLVDDICDSGWRMFNDHDDLLQSIPEDSGISLLSASLFRRNVSQFVPDFVGEGVLEDWIEFPWEQGR